MMNLTPTELERLTIFTAPSSPAPPGTRHQAEPSRGGGLIADEMLTRRGGTWPTTPSWTWRAGS
jgi:hypothetical protein